MISGALMAVLLAAATEDSLHLPEPASPEQFRALLNSSSEHLKVMRRSLESTLPRAAEVSAFIQEVEGKHPNDLKKNDIRIQDKFPAAFLFNYFKGEYHFQGLEIDSAKLKARIHESLSDLAEAQSCIDGLRRGTDPAPLACKHLLRCMNDVGSDDEGLFRYIIGEGYRVTKARVTSSADLDQEFLKDVSAPATLALKRTALKLAFDECRLVAQFVPQREPSSAVLRWKHFAPFETNVSVLKQLCTTSLDDQPLQQDLQGLARRFPDSGDLEHATRLAESTCKVAAQVLCSGVQALDGEAELSFAEKCKVSRARLADLKSQLAATATGTGPDSGLQGRVELIESCMLARGVGYEWESKEPTLAAECRTVREPIPTPPKADLSKLIPAPPPPPPDDSASRRIPAAQAKKRIEQRLWSNFGWNAFRWGMGPGDVSAVLKNPSGDFQAFLEPECELRSPEWKFLVACDLDGMDHVFRVDESAPRLAFSYIDLQLWDASLWFRGSTYAESEAQFQKFRDLLTKKYGRPQSEYLPPKGENGFAYWTMTWETPSLTISLDGVLSDRRPMVSIRYKDPIRSELFNKKASEGKKK